MCGHDGKCPVVCTLFQIGCISPSFNLPASGIQVPSVVDLSKEEVSGTCTDSLLVVSDALHKQVVSKQTGTTQACEPQARASNTDAKNAGELPSNLVPAGQNCIIVQVCCLSAVAFTLQLSSVLFKDVPKRYFFVIYTGLKVYCTAYTVVRYIIP
jgi:hypothetical protein